MLSRYLESCEEGSGAALKNTIYEENDAHKELKKRDYKALFMIHQCIDVDNFEKVSDVELEKEPWEILEKSFGGTEKVK